MSLFIRYFKRYFSEDFNLPRHIAFFLFIGACIWANYEFNIYAKYFRVNSQSIIQVAKLWSMYLFAFFISILILGEFSIKQKPKLLYFTFGAIGLFFVALDSSYYVLKLLRNVGDSIQWNRFTYSCISNLVSLFTIVIPLFILYGLNKKFRPELYGLHLNGAKIRPYIWLILMMAPIVFFSAYLDPDFLAYYPSYDSKSVESSGIPSNLAVLLYEFCYGFDFFSVELMFRGFLIVALSKLVGRKAILPMVACYAFLHFGKPMWETIGSVFGGFGLGILAYESRNIYGGLIVHLGVAWGMEIVAFLLS